MRTCAVICMFLAACGQAETPQGPRHVVLVSLDTTRAAELLPYGGAARTPVLEELASEGVLFEDVTAAAPTTLASHTSMMTGTYPHTHGVVRNGFVVPGENRMLAESFAAAGFHTAGFLGSFALESRFAFDQGFAHFDEEFSQLVDATHDQNQRSASAVTDAALAHIANTDFERLFLFVHYFDAHAPYEPPGTRAVRGELAAAVRVHQERTIGAAPGLAEIINAGPPVALMRDYEPVPSEEDRDLAQRYRGELESIDTQLGRLLDGLAQEGILEDALVIVTGDHGETFWEHGDTWNHGLWVYQTTVHVPLILRFPDGRGAGVRVSGPVSGVDLAPSLWELFGLAPPANAEGVSLLGAMKGEPLERGPVFSQATQPGRRFETEGEWGNLAKTRCVRDGSFKYVFAPYLDYEELFDLAADPGEENNLLAPSTSNEASRETAERLRAELDAWVRTRPGHDSRFDPAQIEAVRERLRQLGY